VLLKKKCECWSLFHIPPPPCLFLSFYFLSFFLYLFFYDRLLDWGGVLREQSRNLVFIFIFSITDYSIEGKCCEGNLVVTYLPLTLHSHVSICLTLTNLILPWMSFSTPLAQVNSIQSWPYAASDSTRNRRGHGQSHARQCNPCSTTSRRTTEQALKLPKQDFLGSSWPNRIPIYPILSYPKTVVYTIVNVQVFRI
jgi:hypothetical protein